MACPKFIPNSKLIIYDRFDIIPSNGDSWETLPGIRIFSLGNVFQLGSEGGPNPEPTQPSVRCRQMFSKIWKMCVHMYEYEAKRD